MSWESFLGSAWLIALYVLEQLNCLKVHIAFPTRCELVGRIWESNCCSWMLLWACYHKNFKYMFSVYECSNWELFLLIPTIFNWRIIIQGLYTVTALDLKNCRQTLLVSWHISLEISKRVPKLYLRASMPGKLAIPVQAFWSSNWYIIREDGFNFKLQIDQRVNSKNVQLMW